MNRIRRISATAGIAALLSLATSLLLAQPQNGSKAHDPGVRTGGATTPQYISTLSTDQISFFQDGEVRFQEIDSVSGTIPGEPGKGLGPRPRRSPLD